MACAAEKAWLSNMVKSEQRILKLEYVSRRKYFDRAVQRAKRKQWFTMQQELMSEAENNSTEFWKSIGRVGIARSRTNVIPFEVKTDDGSISTDSSVVLEKWRSSFYNLFNPHTADLNIPQHLHLNNVDADPNDRLSYNAGITIDEVRKAVNSTKRGKACGFDNMYAEFFKNDTAICFLHVLFNVCFSTGKIPTDWGKGVINPIPKGGTTDPRDPLNYRGITLAPAMYKLYCHILNNRISRWTESENKLNDEQNGFRSKRSTIDHLSTLTSIVETRIKKKLPTCAAFIDFKKAYDSIDRDILWNKLAGMGMKGKMLSAVKSLYSSVKSCVRINNKCTDWFDVAVGLRQGCCVSPNIFNCFLDDLATVIKDLDIGVNIGNGEKLCLLMYADDVVLLTENENDLQILLNTLHEWSSTNLMTINCKKSNVVHFRPSSVRQTPVVFKCGNEIVSLTDKYIYLGLHLSEHLDFNLMARFVAQSAGRALGLLIVKYKHIGGLPYSAYTKLFDSMVWPVISYGAAIWGTRTFSCIESVFNRAMRFYLGTGKYTPNAAVIGDMGWDPVTVRQLKSVGTFWVRSVNMEENRINKRVFRYCAGMSGRTCKNWVYRVCEVFKNYDLEMYTNLENSICRQTLVKCIENATFQQFKCQWSDAVNRDQARTGNGGNKLRSYKLFKNEFLTETYVKLILPSKHRSAFCKFRSGVAPLRIETGRYERIAEEQRVCPFCRDCVENEMHVLTKCPVYEDIRNEVFNKASEVDNLFLSKSDSEKFIFMFSNDALIRIVAKSCFFILNRRHNLLYSTVWTTFS